MVNTQWSYCFNKTMHPWTLGDLNQLSPPARNYFAVFSGLLTHSPIVATTNNIVHKSEDQSAHWRLHSWPVYWGFTNHSQSWSKDIQRHCMPTIDFHSTIIQFPSRKAKRIRHAAATCQLMAKSPDESNMGKEKLQLSSNTNVFIPLQPMLYIYRVISNGLNKPVKLDMYINAYMGSR